MWILRPALWPRPGVIVVLACLAQLGQRADACQQLTYRSIAREQGSNVTLYAEHHSELICADGRRTSEVTYLGPYGDTLATKTLDFTRHVIKPDVVLDDRRTGYREGAIVRGDSIIMFRRLDLHAQQFQNSVRPERLAAINAGFDHAVRRFWDQLVEGERVEFDFAVPDRLRSFHFRIRRLESSSDWPPDTLRLRIEPANWWLRWVVSRIDITYDTRTRRLLTYEGITDMRDARGRRYRARLDFDYPAP